MGDGAGQEMAQGWHGMGDGVGDGTGEGHLEMAWVRWHGAGDDVGWGMAQGGRWCR